MVSVMPCALRAVTVSARQARAAVQRWMQDAPALGCRLDGDAASVRTCTPSDGVSFHVVKMSRRGFVVTSADTRLAPVIAFSSGDELVEDDGNPLWELLKNDVAARVQALPEGGSAGLMGVGAAASSTSGNEEKWARLLGGGMQLLSTSGSQGVASLSDLRVPPLVKSKWDQEDCGFNDCTPSNYPCGCVATAGAQVMRFFCHPAASASLPQYTVPCKVDGVRANLTTQGGVFDWADMPLEPGPGLASKERAALGKLVSDVGICCGMDYREGGSGAGTYMLAYAFTNMFRYANALAFQWSSNVSGNDALRRAVVSNLDAKLPVVLGIKATNGNFGHAVIGDGYGYSDGTLYFHLNFGWSGYGDAWYAPPDMSAYDGSNVVPFNVINCCVCNIFTDQTPGGVICSGRVISAGGAPVENAMVVAVPQSTTSTSGQDTTQALTATTDARGVYALVMPPGTYAVSASFGASTASSTVTLKANTGTRIVTSGSTFGNYFSSPTPVVGNQCGKDFTLAGVETVSPPVLEPPSCLFYPSTNVAVTCATEGAVVRYTLDGTDPTADSPAYAGPICIDDDAVLKARAWCGDMPPSEIVSAVYTYDTSAGPPKGDGFNDPIVIAGTNGRRDVADCSLYTVEDGEPLHTLQDGYYWHQYHTIWYKWTAPASGTATFCTALADWDGGTYIAVYTDDRLEKIERLAMCDEWLPENDNMAVVSLHVKKGATYKIVGMSSDEECDGEFTLYWSVDESVRRGTVALILR